MVENDIVENGVLVYRIIHHNEYASIFYIVYIIMFVYCKYLKRI